MIKNFSTFYYCMQVLMCFNARCYFLHLLCQSFELGLLISLFSNDHFEFEHDVSFRLFSYYVLYVMTTIIISIDIKTHDNN